ncbi:MAG: hypothetical protein ACFBRM_01965 [Pikeienuella sp.]
MTEEGLDLVAKLCRAGLVSHLVEVVAAEAGDTAVAPAVGVAAAGPVYRIEPGLFAVWVPGPAPRFVERLASLLGAEAVRVTELVLEEGPTRDGPDPAAALRAIVEAVSQSRNIGAPISDGAIDAEFLVRAAEACTAGADGARRSEKDRAALGAQLAHLAAQIEGLHQGLSAFSDRVTRDLAELRAQVAQHDAAQDETSRRIRHGLAEVIARNFSQKF